MAERVADHGQRLARIRQLPAHQHHQRKTKEEKNQAAKAVLNADHFVVGRKNVFSPQTELVMLVFVVMMRIVGGVRSQFSGSIHIWKN